MNSTAAFQTSTVSEDNGNSLSMSAIIVISLAAGICSILTVFGNFFVILAFITNKTLRNFSNYLILNLAISDLIIGLFSMNIYVVYNVTGSWTMGKGMCNAWLTVDYTVSNTSVMNLLVICIDRYMAITCPVKYRRRCTPCMAAVVICLAWTISFLLWAPAILLWDVISPTEVDPLSNGGCSIPFMDQSPAVTLITAFVAFYLPAVAMCTLYWRVIIKIERQTSSVSSMISRATNAISSRYTNSWNPKQLKVFLEKRGTTMQPVNEIDDCDDKITKKTVIVKEDNHTKLYNDSNSSVRQDHGTITQSLLAMNGKWNQKHDVTLARRDTGIDKSSTTHLLKKEDTKSCSDPDDSASRHSLTKSEEDSLTKMEEKTDIGKNKPVSNVPNSNKRENFRKLRSQISNLSVSSRSNENRLNREKRATTLLKSILICFISLWIPYNVIVVINGVCGSCDISNFLWILSYWLCYLNSTANPFCYGYCNENFQRTFKALLTNKWWTRRGRREMRCQVSGRRCYRSV